MNNISGLAKKIFNFMHRNSKNSSLNKPLTNYDEKEPRSSDEIICISTPNGYIRAGEQIMLREYRKREQYQ